MLRQTASRFVEAVETDGIGKALQKVLTEITPVHEQLIQNKPPLWLALEQLCIDPPRPEAITPEGQKTLAVTVLMAFWWITEALPISATALLPLVLFPLLKVDSAQEVAIQFGDRNIFLFMGGFFIAMAMQRWDLHKRIALYIVRLLGTSPHKIILGFMAISLSFNSIRF